MTRVAGERLVAIAVDLVVIGVGVAAFVTPGAAELGEIRW
jgi:hypothetical protein